MPPRAALVASCAFLDAALAQVRKDAGEDCRDVRCRRRRDICLVAVEATLALRNRKRRPFGRRRLHVLCFGGRCFSLPVDPGDVRLASKTGATADIPEPPLRANTGSASQYG